VGRFERRRPRVAVRCPAGLEAGPLIAKIGNAQVLTLPLAEFCFMDTRFASEIVFAPLHLFD
jgi:hypothetical protein